MPEILELYPPNLNLADSLQHATKLSTKIVQRLNSNDCPILSDFYTIKANKKITQSEIFRAAVNALNFKPLKPSELKGIYVFGETQQNQVQPIYVGITRDFTRRLKQHGWGKRTNECTLAYNMAKAARNNGNFKEKGIIFKDLDSDLERMKKEVRNLKVVLYPVADDYLLYFYEVVLAGIYKAKWNSFRTH